MSTAPRRLPPLNALRAFEAAARYNSFTKAANELCVTPGAVSRQVQMLEEHLGVPLFARKNREIVISIQGARYREVLSAAFDQINTSTYELRSSKRLHISCYMTFGVRWLTPRLPSFHKSNPQYSIIFTTTPPNIFDVGSGVVDVAILEGHGDWPGVVSHKLFPIELQPVCSPGFLENTKKLREPRDLADVTLLHSTARPDDWANWIETYADGLVDPTEGAMFESSTLAFEAALHGMGVAMGLGMLVAPEIESGRLVKPLEQVYRDNSGYYLCYSTKLAEDPRVKRFRQWIVKEAANFREATNNKP